MRPRKANGIDGVLKRIESEGIRWIDLQFVDLLGGLQHITIPSTSLGPEEFKRGVGKLDGSSIKGFKEIHESDMVMNPDPSTFAVLPWYTGDHRTARMFVDIYEGASHDRFTRDSRYIAQKAAQFAADQGYDTTYWGPEIEFFVFDGIRLTPTPDHARNPSSAAAYYSLSPPPPAPPPHPCGGGRVGPPPPGAPLAQQRGKDPPHPLKGGILPRPARGHA